MNPPRPGGCGPKWQRRPEERRPQIVDAAFRMFSERGFERCTVGEIAELAGVSPGTVAHYFGSKADLFEAVVADRLVSVLDDEAAVVAGRDQPVDRALETHLRRIWDHMREPGVAALASVLDAEAAAFPQCGRMVLRQLYERKHRLVAALLQAGMADGIFRPVDPESTAHLLLLLLIGLAKQMNGIERKKGPLPDPDAIWAGYDGMVLSYLRPEPAGSGVTVSPVPPTDSSS